MNVIKYFANLQGWRYALSCILLGLLAIFGHSPFHVWPIVFIVFASLFQLIQLAPTPRKAFWTAMFVGFGYFMGQVYWIGEAFIVRGPEFIPAMPPMIFGLAFILALLWAVAAWLFKRYELGRRWPYLVLANVFFIAEFTRGHLLGGFPWNLPGYVFKGGEFMSQSASIFGTYGLSLLVLIVSALLARFIWGKSRGSLVLLFVLLASNFIFGYVRLSSTQLDYVDNVKLRIVQVPFDQKDKMDYENPEKAVEIIREHLRVTRAPGLEGITHVIWPEGASDGVAIEDMPLRRAMGDILLSADDTPPVWLMNSLRTEVNPESHYGVDYYNTSAAIEFTNSVEGEVSVFNDKKKLVPFGEFIPGGRIVEEIGAKLISTNLGSITPTSKKTLAQFPGLPIGSPQICYELVFSGLTPKGDNGERPEWILNQTNDAWFGQSVGPYHHANIARYRAIEEKIAVIRSASNGFSGVIDPYGRFISVGNPDSRVAIDSALPQPIGESVNHKLINLLMCLITLLFTLIARANVKFITLSTINRF